MGKYEDLLKLAGNDLRISELLLNTSNDDLMQNSAAYHTQQAVEKIIKAHIERSGKHAGLEHNIGALTALMRNDGIVYPDWVDEYAYDISLWATTIRYNVNYKADHDLIDRINGLLREWMNNNEADEK